MPFPEGDYTPFGYLANPYHRARTYADVDAGLVRSSDDIVGFGWVEPTARKPTLEAGFAVALRWNGRTYQTRSDFARLGYRSAHHSSQLFSFDWELDAVRGSFKIALAGRDALVARVTLENSGLLPQDIELILVSRVWSREGTWSLTEASGAWQLFNQRLNGTYEFATAGFPVRSLARSDLDDLASSLLADGHAAAGYSLSTRLEAGQTVAMGLGLSRGCLDKAPALANVAGAICEARKRSDDEFYEGSAQPVGDWPDAWKRGWVYDLETTRACVFTAGGIFGDEWLSWMQTWPRVVLAEGSLDAARFSYAAPARALALLETLFRDAPAPNIPCVFQGGEPNMVAKDGTICGTSPAWCLPFHNIRLLYFRTLDRSWLRHILPGLASYLQYWLDERTDEAGWAVYKCTWEAGEDCTPRLDPAGEGDEVVSRYVRPVELQAMMSYSARILAELATEVDDNATASLWTEVATDFAARTQQLWDVRTGRFRDWDKRAKAFLQATDQPTYWQTDPIRFSPLSLTPLVGGIANAEQIGRLRSEIEFYDAAPWCFWPSWSYVIAECATTSGWHDVAGRFATRIVDRVYRSNDRRNLADSPRPTPGTSPEFWPLDLAEFNGSDGYGWGATTTSLWVRQIFGFLDDFSSKETAFTLVPNLPTEWLQIGRQFGIVRLPYRGKRLNVVYRVGEVTLEAVVQADYGTVAYVTGDDGLAIDRRHDPRSGETTFAVELNRPVRVVLRDD